MSNSGKSLAQVYRELLNAPPQTYCQHIGRDGIKDCRWPTLAGFDLCSRHGGASPEPTK